MKSSSFISRHHVIAVASGAGVSITIAAVWNLFDQDVVPPSSSYPLTDFLLRSVDLSLCTALVAAAAALGFSFKVKNEIAAGMMLPLPIAAMIEVIIDPTSHNLIPFEIVLYWLPAFGLAWGGAFLGSIAKRKKVKM